MLHRQWASMLISFTRIFHFKKYSERNRKLWNELFMLCYDYGLLLIPYVASFKVTLGLSIQALWYVAKRLKASKNVFCCTFVPGKSSKKVLFFCFSTTLIYVWKLHALQAVVFSVFIPEEQNTWENTKKIFTALRMPAQSMDKTYPRETYRHIFNFSCVVCKMH